MARGAKRNLSAIPRLLISDSSRSPAAPTPGNLPIARCASCDTAIFDNNSRPSRPAGIFDSRTARASASLA